MKMKLTTDVETTRVVLMKSSPTRSSSRPTMMRPIRMAIVMYFSVLPTESDTFSRKFTALLMMVS